MTASRTLALAISAVLSASITTAHGAEGDAAGRTIEGFVYNVTDEAHATQAVIDRTTQEFVFNPPRTYGLRMRVSF